MKLPQGIRTCSGAWTRKGDKLEGRFHVVSASGPQQSEGTVGATIKDAKTLAVFWDKLEWFSKPKNGPWTWRGYGELSWTKIEDPDAPFAGEHDDDGLKLDEATNEASQSASPKRGAIPAQRPRKRGVPPGR
jgi:hypothetical protein